MTIVVTGRILECGGRCVMAPKVGVLDYLPEQDLLAAYTEPYDAAQVAVLKQRLPTERVYSWNLKKWTFAPTWATWALEVLVPMGYEASPRFLERFGKREDDPQAPPSHDPPSADRVVLVPEEPAESQAGLCSVTDLVQGARLVLRAHAPARWVRARLVQFRLTTRDRGSYATVELVDVPSGEAVYDRAVPGKLPAYVASDVLERLVRRYRDVGLVLEDGMEVAWFGKVVVDRFGRLQFEVRDARPEHTRDLAILSLERMKLELDRMGILGKNARLPLPEWPLRIGIVSSRTAEGFRDVLAVLDKSGWRFETVVEEVALQAADTSRQVIEALRRLEGARVDLVALVRGGGSVADLAVFNDLDLAKAIARCPVPVWVGIGHAVHRVLPDFVGRRFETPTEVAREIVSRVEQAWVSRIERWRRCADLVRARIERSEEACSGRQKVLEGLVRRVHEGEGFRLRLRAQRVLALGQRGVQGASEHLKSGRARLALARHALAHEAASLRQRDGQLLHLSSRHLERAQHALERRQRFGDLVFAHLRRADEACSRRQGNLAGLVTRLQQGERYRLQQRDDRLEHVTSRVLDHARHALERFELALRAHDPARLLARGFALVSDAEGKPIRSARRIRGGDRIRLRLPDGQASAIIEKVEPRTEAP